MRTHSERERLFNQNRMLAFAALNAWARANADLMVRYHLEREDLESVALLALWTATATWEPKRGAFSNIVTVSVRHALAGVALDARRLKRGGSAATAIRLDDTTPGSESRPLLAGLTAPEELPASCVERRDTATRLWQAVDALPDRTRDVLTLHYAGDVPLAEAARRLGLSRQRVHQIMARGLLALRSGAGDYDHFF